MASASSKFSSRVQQQTANLIKAIERIHEEENGVYVTRAENISRENDNLRKELYDLQQRIKLLTDRLGFENLERAEESLDEGAADMMRDHKSKAARIEALTAELASANDELGLVRAARIEDQQQLETLRTDLTRKKQLAQEAQTESELNREALGRLKIELQAEWQKTSKLEGMLSSLRKENDAISSECQDLKIAAAKDRAQRSSSAPETPLKMPIRLDNDGTSGVRRDQPILDSFINNTSLPVEVQLAHLRTQYDELLASKVQLSEKYAQDLAKWKTFKEGYLSTNGGNGLIMSEGRLKTRRRVSRQGKDSPTPASKNPKAPLHQLTIPDDEIMIKEEENSFSPGYMHPIRRLQREAGLESPLARQNPSPVSNTDTQESQSTSPAQLQGLNRFLHTSQMASENPTRPTLPAIKHSQSDDEGSNLLRKQSNGAVPLARSHSSPAESPHHRKKPSASTKSLGKRKAFVFDGENDSSDERAASPTGDRTSHAVPGRVQREETREERDARLRALRRKSGPQILADYQQYKGRGRYAAGVPKSGDKTINSEYEIDPTRNEGMPFEFDSVYYEAVGPMPKRNAGPLWRSPPPEGDQSSTIHVCKHHATAAADRSGDMDEEANIAAHKQAVSRHRHKWAPASTPPGYWNIGFPDTQQVEDINRQAVELHDQKRNAVEQEAG
ncbi:myosin-3 [Ceratobasidium sp. AG-Ba]|nr:myosin-3 [Ceratobasidium sp. AG-Ba]